MTDRLLSIAEVTNWSGLSKDSIYRLMGVGDFPAAIRVGQRAVRWRERELEAWLESRPRTVEAVAD